MKPRRIYARVRTAPRRDGRMNGMEAAYALTLKKREQLGEIAAWEYEPEKLRLADKTYYTPDFRVVMADGFVQFHEVKGHWEDDARVKFKLAAELHPYVFVAVTKGKHGWEFEVLNAPSDEDTQPMEVAK